MAGNIDGYFHDNVLVRGSEMAKITNALAGQRSYVIPGYAQGMDITVSGLNVTVQPGMAVIQGYPVVIKQPMMLSLPANSSGYLVITIDKSKDVAFEGDPNDPGSYTWSNNQVALEYVTTLVTGNLSNNDVIHSFSLAQVLTNGTVATISKNADSYNSKGTKRIRLDSFSEAGAYFNASQSVDYSAYYSKLKKIILVWSAYRSGETGISYGYKIMTYEKEDIEQSAFKTFWEPFISNSTALIIMKAFTINNTTKKITGSDINQNGNNRDVALRSVWAEVYI